MRQLVSRWDIVTIGNLSRNPYWGEGSDRAVRPALCTCTLVRSDSTLLLVDPSIADPERMAEELDRRTGLAPADIHAVFITHEHGDHWAGLANFHSADWFAAPAVAEALNGTGRLPKAVKPAQGALLDLGEVIPTPGHTVSHHSLRFECEGKSVLVAGDAVMTRDFWGDRRGFHNSVDFDQAARTMEALSRDTDIIVPGHDNWFLTRT
jgi:glyoxylase-like metal-dependent hydrolase (beta-lactamase superfamily II)